MAVKGVIPTFHIGIRDRITDPDGIVNYVLRHVIMNPGSVTSLHQNMEVAMKKLEGDAKTVSEALFDIFKNSVQKILDRYATDDNKYIVAYESKTNSDGNQVMSLSIKATHNNRVISFDKDFLINATKSFRETIIEAQSNKYMENTPTTGPIQNSDMTPPPPPSNKDRSVCHQDRIT